MRRPRTIPSWRSAAGFLLVSASLGTLRAGETTSPSAHPRLLFTEKEIPALRAKLQTPRGKDLWSRLRVFAEKTLKEPVPVWDEVPKVDGPKNSPAGKRPSLYTMEYTGYKLWALGMGWVLTGEAGYRDCAKKWLAALAVWPHFSDEESDLGLGFAHTLGGYCFAYDSLFNALSEEERGRCREKIRREMENQYKNAPKEWWAWTVIQNHGCWHAGAQILAALALEGEVPEAEKWLKEGLDFVRLLDESTAGRGDGSWAEGIGYQHYAQQAFFPALYSLSARKRADPWEENRYLRGYPAWHLYNYIPSDPDAFLMSFGDLPYGGRRSQISVLPLLFSAWRYKDPHAAWLAGELLDRCKVEWFPADTLVLSLVLLDPDLKPVGPEKLPLDAHLKDLEGVIFRSSWEKDGLVFGLKCGPYGGRWNFDRRTRNELPYNAEARKARGERILDSEYSMGHSHQDAGTFWINWKGVDLTRKVTGYGTRTAMMHNVVLVNGGEQFRCRDGEAGSPLFARSGAGTPVMTSQKDFAFGVANVGPRYLNPKTGENPLEEFTRHVLYVRRDNPGYFVLVDRLIAKEPARFAWNIHFTGGAEREDAWIKGKADNALRARKDGKWVLGSADQNLLLGVLVLSPGNFTYETGVHQDVRDADTGPAPIPRYSRVSHPEAQRELRFVMLMWPGAESVWPNRPAATVLQEDGKELRMQVKAGGRTDTIRIAYGVQGSASVE